MLQRVLVCAFGVKKVPSVEPLLCCHITAQQFRLLVPDSCWPDAEVHSICGGTRQTVTCQFLHLLHPTAFEKQIVLESLEETQVILK